MVNTFNLAEIRVIKGDSSNIKITYPIHIFTVDKLFRIKHLPTSNIDLPQLMHSVLVVFGRGKGIEKVIVELAQKYEQK
jgi:hypothetical protein